MLIGSAAIRTHSALGVERIAQMRWTLVLRIGASGGVLAVGLAMPVITSPKRKRSHGPRAIAAPQIPPHMPPMSETNSIVWHGTTILSVRKSGKVVIAGDGQVSAGSTV